MARKFLYILLISGFSFLIHSCINSNKQNELQFDNINNLINGRSVISDDDTIKLFGFEFYNIVKLQNHDFGLYNFLNFEVLDTIQKFKFYFEDKNLARDTIVSLPSPFKKISFSSCLNNYDEINGRFRLNLKLSSGILHRNLSINQIYKVIYAFTVDTETLRDNIATEYCSDFEIIDIVPLGNQFYRATIDD